VGSFVPDRPICSTNDHPPLEGFLGWQKTLSPRSVAMAHAGKNAGARGVEARGGSAGGQSACVGAGRGGAGGASRQVAGRQAGVSLIFQQSRADARAPAASLRMAGAHGAAPWRSTATLAHAGGRPSGMMCGALLAPGARYALRTPHDSDRGAAAPKQAGAQRAARAKARWRATCGTPLALRRTLRAVGGACGLAGARAGARAGAVGFAIARICVRLCERPPGRE